MKYRLGGRGVLRDPELQTPCGKRALMKFADGVSGQAQENERGRKR